MRYTEGKKENSFSLIYSSISSKVSHWNSEGTYSLEKLEDLERIGKNISGCEDQVT